MGWVQGLEGVTLVFVICGLLFVEEVGVPLPFAPGDLVLAIGGIAIAGGRVSAAAIVAGATIAKHVERDFSATAVRVLHGQEPPPEPIMQWMAPATLGGSLVPPAVPLDAVAQFA